MNNIPAFPNEGGTGNLWNDKGMTLRDYFAAKAMQSMGDLMTKPYNNLHSKAEIAYQMADAMMKARET